MSNKKDLGTIVKTIRTYLGLSTQELAKRSNVSSSYVNKIENNKAKSPDIPKLLRVTKALNIDAKLVLECTGCDRSVLNNKNDIKSYSLENILLLHNFSSSEISDIMKYIEYIKYNRRKHASSTHKQVMIES